MDALRVDLMAVLMVVSMVDWMDVVLVYELAGHLADCSVASMALLWVVSKDAMKVVQTGCSTAVSLVDETACAMVAW